MRDRGRRRGKVSRVREKQKPIGQLTLTVETNGKHAHQNSDTHILTHTGKALSHASDQHAWPTSLYKRLTWSLENKNYKRKTLSFSLLTVLEMLCSTEH